MTSERKKLKERKKRHKRRARAREQPGGEEDRFLGDEAQLSTQPPEAGVRVGKVGLHYR